LKSFLYLKPWQFYILIIAAPLLAFVGIINTILTKKENVLIQILLFSLLFMAFIHFNWIYATATNLYKKLPFPNKMNIKLFKTAFFSSLLYFLSLSIFIYFSILNKELNTAIILWLIPVHLFFIFCIYYQLYFIAKALKSVELQYQVIEFKEFKSEFYSILEIFIYSNVWNIQKRINKIFSLKK